MSAAAPLLVAHLGLLLILDLTSHLWLTLGLLALAMMGLGWAYRRLGRLAQLSATGVLLIAAALRVLLLPLPPTLSDDVVRYVWDGRVAGAGYNPYVLAPEATELEGLRDSLWERLSHREVPTVYPPLALTAFSITARLPVPIGALKVLLVLADLFGCALLLRLAGRLGIPSRRVIWYAWNPLVCLEVAGMGHVDALGSSAVVATVLTLGSRQIWAPAGAAAAAALVKLVPVAVFPAWARQSRHPRAFLTVAIGLTALALLPVLWDGGGLPPGLVVYGVSWEFNGPLYEPLWRLWEGIGLSTGVKLALDRMKDWSGAHDFWNLIYPYAYSQFLAKLVLAVALLTLLARIWRRPDPVSTTGLVLSTVLLFSATVYPWYLVWVLPWAALCLQPAWIALSGLILISYLPQHTAVDLVPWPFLAIWVPFFVLLLWRPQWSTD